jgi:multidrug transporter EmrE-like cation transporter
MKYIYLSLVVLLEVIFAASSKLLDNFSIVINTYLTILIIGLLVTIYARNKNKRIKDIGFGILYGTLAIIFFGFIFMVWLAFNFPG